MTKSVYEAYDNSERIMNGMIPFFGPLYLAGSFIGHRWNNREEIKSERAKLQEIIGVERTSEGDYRQKFLDDANKSRDDFLAGAKKGYDDFNADNKKAYDDFNAGNKRAYDDFWDKIYGRNVGNDGSSESLESRNQDNYESGDSSEDGNEVSDNSEESGSENYDSGNENEEEGSNDDGERAPRRSGGRQNVESSRVDGSAYNSTEEEGNDTYEPRGMNQVILQKEQLLKLLG
jgi:hypothetical protein